MEAARARPRARGGHFSKMFQDVPRVLTLAFDGRASWSCQVGLGIALELFNQQVNLVASSP